MSGHSKWSTIKRKKGEKDGARAKVFTKISREIIVAIKEGGGDPNNNAKLATLIQKAKSNNIPNDNIDRLIKKAVGGGEKNDYENCVYEGYGPNGVAVIVDCLTDNRNRTAGEVRHYFDKFGGNMGTQGCVSFMFSKKGVLVIEREDLEKDEDTVMSDALECGASDFEADDDVFTIYTETDDFGAVRDELEKLGYTMEDVKNRNVVGISKKVSDYKELADEVGVGEITLRDIVKELEKPARDPREDMPKPILRSDVLEMKDLTPGMVLKGTVRNVIDFGCFVDIGVHQDGLVHISEICDRYIKHPLEAVSVGDIVDVQVMSVDLKKQRIQLTMKIGQGTDKAGKSENSGSSKDSAANKADRSNRNNGGRNSRNDRNSTGSKNNNNRNKKPHYIKGKKNNFFDNIILDN